MRRTKEGPVPFGHCLTGNHDRCKTWTISFGKKVYCVCKCENHGVNYKPSPPPSDLLLEMIEKWQPGK